MLYSRSTVSWGAATMGTERATYGPWWRRKRDVRGGPGDEGRLHSSWPDWAGGIYYVLATRSSRTAGTGRPLAPPSVDYQPNRLDNLPRPIPWPPLPSPHIASLSIHHSPSGRSRAAISVATLSPCNPTLDPVAVETFQRTSHAMNCGHSVWLEPSQPSFRNIMRHEESGSRLARTSIT